MIKKLLFLLFIISQNTNAQHVRKKLYGRVTDNLGALENIHIINMNTKKATYTNLEGQFLTFARVNDTLKITSIGYKTKFILLKLNDFSVLGKDIKLEKETIVLDEVELKNHNLTGYLANDIKQVPEDRIEKIVSTVVNDIKSIDFHAPAIDLNDHISQKVRPQIVIVDPIDKVNSSITAIGIFNLFRKKKKRTINTEKKISNEQLPDALLSYYGKYFFTESLKIPANKIDNFIQYCSYKNILQLYQSKSFLELTNVLRKESVTYLAINNR